MSMLLCPWGADACFVRLLRSCAYLQHCLQDWSDVSKLESAPPVADLAVNMSWNSRRGAALDAELR